MRRIRIGHYVCPACGEAIQLGEPTECYQRRNRYRVEKQAKSLSTELIGVKRGKQQAAKRHFVMRRVFGKVTK